MMTSRRRAVYRLLIPAVAAAAVASATAACSDPASPALAAPGPQASVSGSWPTAGHDIGNTRDTNGEHIIGPGNASRLTMAWSITTPGEVSDTPTEYDGVVYFTDKGGKLWAVAGDSGRVLWSDEVSGYTGFPAESRTSPAVYGDELVLGDSSGPGHGAYVFAVSRRTGRLIWRTKVDTNPAAIITSSPVLYRGVAYLGVSSEEEALAAEPGYRCCTFRGSVVALNARTGRLLWQTYTVPPGYSGGAVWGSTPAIDPADNLVYVGTGNNYSAPAGICTATGEKGCAPPPAGDHVDSVLALDVRTGAVRWFMSTLSSDVNTQACTVHSMCGPDFDFGSGPNLFRLPSGRELLGIGQKSGVYWALDPKTGTVAWHRQVGPGSAFGGMQWGSATDGRHIYVAIGNVDSRPYTITSASGHASTTSGGSWAALDAATGKILWQVADPQQAADLGYVSIASGLVYAGSTADTGNDMYVLDASTGKILWRFASGAPVTSGAAIAGGSVYWGSGYALLATRCPDGIGAIKACEGSGNKMYAFRLERAGHR
jgi:polyvinyl alcohol dehydrogenase (cytochrome)